MLKSYIIIVDLLVFFASPTGFVLCSWNFVAKCVNVLLDGV